MEEEPKEKNSPKKMHFSGRAIIRNSKGEYLLVRETDEKGWMFPGGAVEKGETVVEGVVREVLEEAGIDVEITKVICVEHLITSKEKMRYFFYGEPKDEDQSPKAFSDHHSEEAKWMSFSDLMKIESSPLGWRRSNVTSLVKHIESGGELYDVSVVEGVIAGKNCGQTYPLKKK